MERDRLVHGGAVPWWGWLLIAWAVVAVVCGFWFAAALSNADVQDEARRIAEDEPAKRREKS